MNSIFRKQFFLLTAGLIVSFTLLTVGVIQAFNTYFYNQKEQELGRQADEIKKIVNECYVGTDFNETVFQNKIVNAAPFFDYSFVIVNSDFSFQWQSDINGNSIDMESIKELKGYDDVFKGEKVAFKYNPFREKKYCVGYPVQRDDTTVGALFLSASVDQIMVTTYDSYRIIIIFMCIAIIINFFIMFYSSKKYTEPLRQMSDAAKKIAGGDFEKRLNIDSDDEIGVLADSFNEMAQSLYFQEKHRREFISNISHDLRSPLTSMRGFLQAILDGTIPPEKQNHYLQIVLDESERLAKMANAMLDINKLDDSESALNLTEFSINELATKIMFNFEDRAVQSKIKISCIFSNKDTIVKADADKIQRVLYNLVDNSLKFTHKYGYIKIITEVVDKKVRISVKDNGKGVSPEEQKRVFERLYKADRSRGKDKKGSGLGLSIVREFIKAHGEEITLNSEIGKGCTFKFTLPLISKGEEIDNE